MQHNYRRQCLILATRESPWEELNTTSSISYASQSMAGVIFASRSASGIVITYPFSLLGWEDKPHYHFGILECECNTISTSSVYSLESFTSIYTLLLIPSTDNTKYMLHVADVALDLSSRVRIFYNSLRHGGQGWVLIIKRWLVRRACFCFVEGMTSPCEVAVNQRE